MEQALADQSLTPITRAGIVNSMAMGLIAMVDDEQAKTVTAIVNRARALI